MKRIPWFSPLLGIHLSVHVFPTCWWWRMSKTYIPKLIFPYHGQSAKPYANYMSNWLLSNRQMKLMILFPIKHLCWTVHVFAGNRDSTRMYNFRGEMSIIILWSKLEKRKKKDVKNKEIITNEVRWSTTCKRTFLMIILKDFRGLNAFNL